MKKKFTRYIAFIFAFIILFSFLSFFSFADTGPKPSVNIDFKNTGNKSFYVTLLSKTSPGGPWSYSENTDLPTDYGIESDIWKAFRSYEDGDGFYLLPYIKKCSDSFRWGYYPPKTFKVLIYFPTENLFAVSKIYERYAFDSYYEIDLKSISTPIESSSTLVCKLDCNEIKSYDYKGEFLGLIARIAVTLSVELGVAYLFGYRGKKTFLTLLLVNLATQLLLNTALNVEAYRYGTGYNYYELYIKLEALIFAIEGLVYFFTLHKFRKEPDRWVSILYALLANLSSLAFGYKLSSFLPLVF